MGSQAPPWQQPLLLSREPRGPSPAHLRSSDSSTGSCRLGASSESRSRAYCGPRRAPGPSLHPPPGRMASLAAQMCEPGRGLPARGSAEGAQPEPLPVPSQHSSPAGQRCLPCSEGSTGGWDGRRQRGRSRACGEFQTLKDLLLLGLPQPPTLRLGLLICGPEPSPLRKVTLFQVFAVSLTLFHPQFSELRMKAEARFPGWVSGLAGDHPFCLNSEKTSTFLMSLVSIQDPPPAPPLPVMPGPGFHVRRLVGKALTARCLLELCPELTYPALPRTSRMCQVLWSLCPTKAPAASRPFLLVTRSPRPSRAQGGELL